MRYGPDGTRLQRKVVPATGPAQTTTFFADVEIDPDGTWTKVPLPDAKLVGTGVDALMYGIHADYDGSVRVVTNRAGAAVTAISTIPYGTETRREIAAAPAAETRSFIGERYDASTGMTYLNARYYDPDVGRFMSPDWFDPLMPGVGTNLYAYGGNDPINMQDPGGNSFNDGAESLDARGIGGGYGFEGGGSDGGGGFGDGGGDAGFGFGSSTGGEIGINPTAAVAGPLSQPVLNAQSPTAVGDFLDGAAKSKGRARDRAIGGIAGVILGYLGLNAEEPEPATDESGPATPVPTGPTFGNPEVDAIFGGSSGAGPKGWETPKSQKTGEAELAGVGAQVQTNNGTSTTLPDGSKIDTYGKRTSTGKPGWAGTSLGGAYGDLGKGSWTGD